ncbi:MAG TPA: DUF6282 family protein [Chloroflexota bacterium]|nr:DUF6282 family protein [Chloroflexota bacterium]
MGLYEEFLADAIDLHCHIDLEFATGAFRKREPEWEWLPKAEALGMRGILLKSHWWPTAVATPYIRELYRGPVEPFSSVVLNPVVGGTELWAVESAAALGARMVFLPTWGSCHDLRVQGHIIRNVFPHVYETFHPEQIAGTSFLDDQGRLTARGCELVAYCDEHDLTLGTGHVSWQESLAVIEEAHARGYGRVVFTHPLSGGIETPLEAAQRAASLGAWIEICWTNVAPGRMDPVDVVNWIKAVGVEQVVVSTDYFRTAQPSPPELFRLLLGTLYDAGLTAAEIRTVAALNPARALGLEPPATRL